MIGALARTTIPSTVVDRQGGGLRRRPDANGFVTALAARAWRTSGRVVPDAWLDVLQSCRADQGGFSFWPHGRAPAWAPRLVPDTDDTAVMGVELLLAGRLGLADARRLTCHAVAAQRLQQLPAGSLWPGPVWPRVGMFTTWHRRGARTDLVDATVTANALALLAITGLLSVEGVDQSVEAISAGVTWAGEDGARLASLSPFYPEPDELRLAVQHAVVAGCHQLEPVAALLGAPAPAAPDAAVCSSPYGLVTWHSPALQIVRGMAAEPGSDR